MESAPQEKNLAQVRYFDSLAKSLPNEMRLLFRGGKLWKKEGWRNVAEHCLLQAAAADVVSELIKLPAEDHERLVKTAAVHDWAKHLERKPDDFTPEEKEEAEKLVGESGMDPLLMESTGPDFYVKTFQHPETVTLAERLQCYIDDITRNTEIVSLQERLDDVEARRQDLNEDEHYTEIFGKKFWDYVREYETQFESELFTILKDNDVEIEQATDIPARINEEIQKRIMTRAEKTSESHDSGS